MFDELHDKRTAESVRPHIIDTTRADKKDSLIGPCGHELTLAVSSTSNEVIQVIKLCYVVLGTFRVLVVCKILKLNLAKEFQW